MKTNYGAWRATYTRGQWVVLSGPSAMIIMHPAPAAATDFINGVWDSLLDSASISQISADLTAWGLDIMPNLAVFFWDDEQLHCLLRGGVRVLDADSGEVLAAGAGARTWYEISLRTERVYVPLDNVDPAGLLQLPLVVGAVEASAVYLDATSRLVPSADTEPEATPEVQPFEEPERSEEEAPAGITGFFGALAPVAGAVDLRLVAPRPAVRVASDEPTETPVERYSRGESQPEPVDTEQRPDDIPTPDSDDRSADLEQVPREGTPFVSETQPEQVDGAHPVDPAPLPGFGEQSERSAAEPPQPDPGGSIEVGRVDGERTETEGGEPWRSRAAEGTPVPLPDDPEPRPFGFSSESPSEPETVPPEPGDVPEAESVAPEPHTEPEPGARQMPPLTQEPTQVLGNRPPFAPGQAPADFGTAFGLGVAGTSGPWGAQGFGAAVAQPQVPAFPEPPAPAPAWPDEAPQKADTKRPTAQPRQVDTGSDHDGETVFTTGIAATHKPVAGRNTDSNLVLAASCALGHPNPPGAVNCRVCGGGVDSHNPRLVNRPVLAVVVTSSGEERELTGPILVGRAPTTPGNDLDAELLRVPSPNHDISRTHLRIAPHEWAIEVSDLHSTNGTTLRTPGGQLIKLDPGQTVELEIGGIVDLGDGQQLSLRLP